MKAKTTKAADAKVERSASMILAFADTQVRRVLNRFARRFRVNAEMWGDDESDETSLARHDVWISAAKELETEMVRRLRAKAKLEWAKAKAKPAVKGKWTEMDNRTCYRVVARGRAEVSTLSTAIYCEDEVAIGVSLGQRIGGPGAPPYHRISEWETAIEGEDEMVSRWRGPAVKPKAKRGG